MNKKDILARSKQEFKNGDEKDLLDHQISFAIGASAATLLCMILFVTESCVFERSGTPLWIVYTGTCFATALVSYLRSKKSWQLFASILTGLGFICFCILYCLGK